MSDNVTRGEIRTRAVQRADVEGETTRFPLPVVNGHINESIADLTDLLLRAKLTSIAEVTSSPVTIVPGTSVYALAAAFYELLAIEINDGVARYPLELFSRRERPYLSDGNVGWRGVPYYYILTGNNVELLPTPQSSGMTFTYRYLPTAPSFNTTSGGGTGDDNLTFDAINGWEEWVVVDVARKIATVQRDFALVQALEADRQRLTDRIKALAGARDRVGERRVVDVRRPWGWRRRGLLR